jgi:hypothetical protein
MSDQTVSNIDIDEDETKTVYAHFGLASYAAQVFERGMIFLTVVSRVYGKERYKSQEEFESAFTVQEKNTLGKLFKILKTRVEIDEALTKRISDAINKRNWLIHGYFYDRAPEFTFTKGRKLMVKELEVMRDEFFALDTVITERFVNPLSIKAGVTDESLEKYTERMITETYNNLSES